MALVCYATIQVKQEKPYFPWIFHVGINGLHGIRSMRIFKSFVLLSLFPLISAQILNHGIT